MVQEGQVDHPWEGLEELEALHLEEEEVPQQVVEGDSWWVQEVGRQRVV